MAVIYTQVEVIEALLDCGARVDLADWKGDAPVATARKYCKHSGNGNKRCCQVLKMLLEAEKSQQADTSIQQQADRLRNQGNEAFQRKEYRQARDLYTQSLDVLEDYRAFSNRSLCNLEIGKAIIRKEWPNGKYPLQVVRWGEEGMSDAMKACQMNQRFAKTYYRMALGHAMSRDFPRAKMDVKEGLKKSTEKEALSILLDELNELGVPDSISNPYSDANEEACRKAQSGAAFGRCVFCCGKVPLPLEGTCPLCAMDLETQVSEDAIVAFILKH